MKPKLHCANHNALAHQLAHKWYTIWICRSCQGESPLIGQDLWDWMGLPIAAAPSMWHSWLAYPIWWSWRHLMRRNLFTRVEPLPQLTTVLAISVFLVETASASPSLTSSHLAHKYTEQTMMFLAFFVMNFVSWVPECLKTTRAYWKSKILVEGSQVATPGYGSIVQNCVARQLFLLELGMSVIVTNTRFCKSLDMHLMRRLVHEHEVLITIEEGSIKGFLAHMTHFLSLSQACLMAVSRWATIPPHSTNLICIDII